MAEELILQDGRRVIDEPGMSLRVDLTGDNAAALGQLADSGYYALSNALYDPIGGVVMGQPVWGIYNTVDYAPYRFGAESTWTATGANWTSFKSGAAAPFRTPYGNDPSYAMCYRAAGEAWTLTSAPDWAIGTPLLVSWLTYHQRGQESSELLTIEFGGVWKLQVAASGKAALDRWDAGTAAYAPIGQFSWMTGPWAPALHTLWIYQVGPKLVIRNVMSSEQNQALGMSYWDETAPVNIATGARDALRAGPVTLSGTGYIAIGCDRQRFAQTVTSIGPPAVVAPVTSSFSQVPLSGVGVAGEGSTQGAWAQCTGRHSDGLTVVAPVVVDQAGLPWGPTPGIPRYGVRYDVAWTTTETQTYYLAAVDVVIPRTTRLSGQTGTDVLAVATVADRSITVSREGGLDRERMTAEIFTGGAPIAAYTQPNMCVRYRSAGVNRFLGYTTSAQWSTIADAQTVVGVLSLECEGQWSRFRRAMWPGGRPFDGRRLTDCLIDVVHAAGLDASEYSIVADPWVIPAQPEGEPPAMVYRAGTTCDRILEELRDQFFGMWLTMYFRVTDGVFVVEYARPRTGAAVAAFYSRSADAVAAGTPWHVILDGTYAETLDQSEMANCVTVIGQDPNRQPLMARCVDWASIRDQSVPNFVGEPWHLIVTDPGFATQGAVDWVCRSLWDRHRWPRVYAEWQSVRTDLWPGDLVSLVGPSYGGLYQIKGVQLERAAEGDAADPLGRATYQAERVA